LRYGKGAVPIGFPCRCRGIPCIVVKELSRLDFAANVRLFFIHVRVYLFLEVHMNRREFHILFMVFFVHFPVSTKVFILQSAFFVRRGVPMGQIPNLEKLMAFCWLVSAPLLLYIDKRAVSLQWQGCF